MDSNTQEQINGRISALPRDLQDLLSGAAWKASVHVIADKQNLKETQKESLETEVFLVLAGLEPLSSFRSNIINELGITYDQALKISSDVNSNIFNSVVGILKNIEEDIKQIDIEEEGMETSSSSGAEQILSSQFGESERKVEQKKSQQTTHIDTKTVSAPERLIPDHKQLTKTDGPHTHTQSVPPIVAPVATTVITPPAIAIQPKPAFKSIVDQKLSGLVRSSNSPMNKPTNAPTNLPMNEKDLEEMMKKSEGVKIGYKGIDPYREPIE
jgi:hypothetical protein